MFLKRVYERDESGRPVSKSPKGVRILSLGASPNQHFSTDFVISAVRQGWATLVKDKFTIKAENGDVEYNVLREPGYYCCHCGQEILDAGALMAEEEGKPQMTVGQAHVLTHGSSKSPDPSNPAGYERINYYDCVEATPRDQLKLEPAQTSRVVLKSSAPNQV